MKELWNNRKTEKETALKTINQLIRMNVEEIDEYVIEYLDDARSGEELLVELERLKSVRNSLLDVKEGLEQDIAGLQDLIENC